MLSVLQHF